MLKLYVFSIKRQQTIDQINNHKVQKPRRSPTFRVIKVNFDSKLPQEISQANGKTKKKKKKPAKSTKLALMPNE